MVREGLPRSARLGGSREFAAVARQGWKAHTAHFLIQGLPRTDDALRLGLTVSRKVGKAHDRNLVKRRLREVFRRRQSEIREALFGPGRAPSGADLVVIAKSGAPELGPGETEREFLGGLGRLGRQRKPNKE